MRFPIVPHIMTFKILPVILMLLMIGSSSCQSQGGYFEENPALVEAQTVSGTVKAPVFELTDLEGKSFSLSDLAGKVVFLDFWATWCPPCVISTPEIEKLGKDYDPEKLVIISISLDTDEAAVHRFVKKMKVENRVAMAGQSQVDLQYRVGSIPSFYLIDQKGFLRGAWNGYHPGMIKTWRKEFDKLLKV